jgi:hypothetical protein
MTLTSPAINRARQVMWVVTGAEKHKSWMATQRSRRGASTSGDLLCWRMPRLSERARGDLNARGNSNGRRQF